MGSRDLSRSGQQPRIHGGGEDSFGYGLSKLNLQYLSKAIARFGGKYNIISNCINPGYIDTKFHTKVMGRSKKDLKIRKVKKLTNYTLGSNENGNYLKDVNIREKKSSRIRQMPGSHTIQNPTVSIWTILNPRATMPQITGMIELECTPTLCGCVSFCIYCSMSCGGIAPTSM